MARKRVERNIYFDDEKKKYYVNLDFGKDETGKQIKKYKTFAKITDARKALRLHESERDRGMVVVPKEITVSDWLTYWMDNIVAPNREVTTVYAYWQMIKNHINPNIGSIQIQKLTPLNIQQYYVKIHKQSGLSQNTVRKHHDLLRTALKAAVMQDVLIQNPTDRVASPKTNTPLRRFYNKENLIRLLKEVEGNRLEIVVKLAGYLGLRREEICGLKWSCVDFKNKVIRIREARTMAGSTVVSKCTKNKSSERSLFLPEDLERALKIELEKQQKYKTFLKDEYNDTGFIVVWEDGTPYRPNYVSEIFSKFIVEHNLPVITLHGLRHTFATLANSQGTPLYNISKALGHSTTATTANIYTHLLDDTHESTVQGVADILKQSAKNKNGD